MKLWKCTIGWRPVSQPRSEPLTSIISVAADSRPDARTICRQQWELVKPKDAQYLWCFCEEETEQMTLGL